MAGHSQFKNIMHRKGAQDKKRAQQFAKLGREIIVAARSGGPDPEANPRLRAAIQSARAANMPKDNVERAIRRATGEGGDVNYEEIRYEGYGPGGVAVMVETLTDNRNRTAAEIRAIFSKNGGSLGESNSVAFQFERIGEIVFPRDVGENDVVFEAAAEAGAEDVQSGDQEHMIACAVEDFSAVRDRLSEHFGDPQSASLVWRPLNSVPVGEDQAETLLKLIDALDDNDDVQQVSANFDIADDVLARLTA